jgi:UDP-N-acetylmuramyl pentapeptide synthase
LGRGRKDIISAIEGYAPIQQPVAAGKKGTSKIILDAYNANPSSMKAAIDNFARAEGDNKYWCWAPWPNWAKKVWGTRKLSRK